MPLTRRDFLRSVGITAGAAAVVDLVDGPFWLVDEVQAQPLALSELENLAGVALQRAKQLGATYADIRINRYRNRSISLRTSPERGAPDKVNHVPGVLETGSFGFGVRVIHSGSWGFAASPQVTKEAIGRATDDAVAIA